jgi:hypothetical protein
MYNKWRTFVSVPVKFNKKHPIDRYVRYGVSLQLLCMVTGIPAPELEWLDKNDTVVSEHAIQRTIM